MDMPRDSFSMAGCKGSAVRIVQETMQRRLLYWQQHTEDRMHNSLAK